MGRVQIIIEGFLINLSESYFFFLFFFLSNTTLSIKNDIPINSS